MMLKRIILKIRKIINYIFLRKYKGPFKEERKCYGRRNPEETIYVIRRPSERIGLMSYVITALGHIHRAVNMNYKIVIDMKNYSNMYQQHKKDNAWEYFFEQPSELSLGEAYKSRNVILSSDAISEDRPNDSLSFFYTPETRLYWHKLCEKFLRINTEVLQYVDRIEKELFNIENKEEKVLGVLCRGTDYTHLKPKNHPIQPSVQQMIDKINELKLIYNIDKIFLVTEDQTVLERFKKEFSTDELKFLDTKRFNAENEYLVTTMQREKIDTKQQGIDYLAQILLLAKCNYFIGGRTSGSVGVALFAEGFEYEYYWDLGRY